MSAGPTSINPALASGRSALRVRASSPSLVLFLALFASQSGVLVLSPILSEVADEFDVSVASAGQLRILAAPLAAIVALAAARALVRVSPRALLGVGGGLVALGAAASAASSSFALLALAQVPLWAGISMLLTAAIAASAAWTAPEERTHVVAHMFAGPPSAWIVGMPVIGVVAEVDWRLAFLALPLPAGLLALLAAAGRPKDTPISGAGGSLRGLLRRPAARGWAVGELLATSAWAGTLVFSGALLTEQYGMSTTATGVALAAVAVAYLLGNRRAGRGEAGLARRAMLGTSVLGAAAVALMWAFTPTVAVTLLLFALSGAMVATRTVSATVYGFSVAGDPGREVGAARAVTTQLGYLIGSLAGGAALAVGGFPLLALALGGLMLASTLPYASVLMRRRPASDETEAGPVPTGSVSMPTRAVRLRHGRTLLVRPLRNGDTDTVLAVFERLGERSRQARFNGPKPRLSSAELESLALVDPTRHVLVGYLEGDRRPVAIARLVRDGASAEIAFEVVDEHQRLGIGSALTAELLADARAAGIAEVTALVASDNTPAVSLLRRVLGHFEMQFEGPELAIRAVLA
jgi:DHA1 family inner membrane transport protein